jgi:hypothetical protein
MCELHFHKCACGARWTEAKKLSSCDDPADTTGAKCPDSLCMHVGNPRRPQKKECEPCRVLREMLESMEEDEEEDAVPDDHTNGAAGGGKGG